MEGSNFDFLVQVVLSDSPELFLAFLHGPLLLPYYQSIAAALPTDNVVHSLLGYVHQADGLFTGTIHSGDESII